MTSIWTITEPQPFDKARHNIGLFECRAPEYTKIIREKAGSFSAKEGEAEFIFAAETPGQPLRVAAYIHVYRNNRDIAISRVATDLEFERMGLAACLIRYAVIALSAGRPEIEKVRVVSEENTEGLYAKLGLGYLAETLMEAPLRHFLDTARSRHPCLRPGFRYAPSFPEVGPEG